MPYREGISNIIATNQPGLPENDRYINLGLTSHFDSESLLYNSFFAKEQLDEDLAQLQKNVNQLVNF